MRSRILPGLVSLTLMLNLIPVGLAGSLAFIFTPIDIPGAANTFAFGINDAGQVAGFYGDMPPFFCPGNPNAVDHGFTFDGTTFTNPIDVPGAPSTYAGAINTFGEVVGLYGTPATTAHGFTFDGTSFTNPIDVPGAPNTFATALNDSGQIAGFYGPSFPPDGCGQPPAQHGFLFDGTAFTNPVDVPGAIVTQILGINNLGQFSGGYFSSDGKQHGFFFDGTNFNTVDVPGAMLTVVYKINDSGEMVGSFQDATGQTHGFFFDQTIFTTVDFPGAVGTVISGINNVGQVSGAYSDVTGKVHGFIAAGSP